MLPGISIFPKESKIRIFMWKVSFKKKKKKKESHYGKFQNICKIRQTSIMNFLVPMTEFQQLSTHG